MDGSYLLMGLDALCRAHASDCFGDGHRGASVIAAFYLCRENEVEAGVPEAIGAMIDHHWGESELFSGFPDEPADQALTGRIAAGLAARVGGLRQVGHDVILPSLALRAFRDLPEAVTPARVEGVCRLMETFAQAEETPAQEAEGVPAPDATGQMAAFVLRETLGSIARFDGRGQGWSGHMLTFGRALIDLVQLGYPEAAEGGMGAFRRYVARARMGPQSGDKVCEEHPDTGTDPLQLAYWERRAGLPVGIGHCFKYPYAFYGLMALAEEPDLRRACLAQSYHVF
jgi:hypothetical protein